MVVIAIQQKNRPTRMKKTFASFLAFVFLALFTIYTGFETIKYLSGPSLEIVSPKDFETTIEPSINIRGVVKRAAYITINGKQIFADTNGEFGNELLLPPGYSIIRILVKDRFGKEIYRDIHVTYLRQIKPKPADETTENLLASTTATSTEEN